MTSDSAKTRNAVYRDYVRSLTNEALVYLGDRLLARVGGDLGDVTCFLQETPEVDLVLRGAQDADAFYNMLDEISLACEREMNRRGLFA